MTACAAMAVSEGPVVTLAGIGNLLREMTDGQAEREDVGALLDAVRRHVMAHGVVCGCLDLGDAPVRAIEPAVRPVESPKGAKKGKTPGKARKATQKRAQGPMPHQVIDPRETARICRVCLEIRPIDDFGRTRNGVKGRRTACRSCENTRKRAARNPGT